MPCHAITPALKRCRGVTQNRFCHVHKAMENVSIFYRLVLFNMTPYLKEKQTNQIIRCMKLYQLNNIARCIAMQYHASSKYIHRATIIYSLLIRAGYPPLSIHILWRRCLRSNFQMLNHLSPEKQTLDIVRACLSIDKHLFTGSPLQDILAATWDFLKTESISAQTWSIITRVIIEYAPIHEVMTLPIDTLERACLKWQPTGSVIGEMKSAANTAYHDAFKGFKEELLATSMHPSRMVKWCLSDEEKARWGC